VDDLAGTHLAELIEEPLQRGVVSARSSPHQPARVVIDDHGQVAVPTLVGDLIDPDPAQPRQPVDPLVDVAADPGDDRPDGTPRNPQQLDHRHLRHMHRQPRRLIVEIVSVTGTVAGPRDLRHSRSMLTATHPRRVRLNEHLRRSEIKCPPPAPTVSPVELR
jgi:hypothetical protein